MIQPLVSVVIAVFNERLDFIVLAVESIRRQTYSNLEIIVVNDNPASIEHKKLLHSFAGRDHRIVLLENDHNLGLTRSLNIGISCCNGKFIARMDADDIAVSTRIEKQLKYLELHQDVGLVGSAILNFNSKFAFRLQKFPEEHDQIVNELLLRNCLAHPTILFRSSCLNLINSDHFYNESFRVAQDYKLYVDLLKYTRFGNISEPLLLYRRSSSQISAYRSEEQARNADICRLELLEYLSLLNKGVYYSNLVRMKLFSKRNYSLNDLCSIWISGDLKYLNVTSILRLLKRMLKTFLIKE